MKHSVLIRDQKYHPKCDAGPVSYLKPCEMSLSLMSFFEFHDNLRQEIKTRKEISNIDSDIRNRNQDKCWQWAE